MRTIDNSRVRARHVVRATSSTPGAVQVLPGQWWAPAAGSIEGRQGWQSAVAERRVSDHGTMQLALPNAAGEDGAMHRDRFAVRTDPEYRLGTEWVEFTDADAGRPLGVATPDSARVDGTTVGLTGVDAAGLLSGFREGKVAPWTPHSPQDVIDWYSQAPTGAIVDNMQAAVTTGWALAASLGNQSGFVSGTLAQTSSGVTVTPTAGGSCVIKRNLAHPTLAGCGWAIHVDVRMQMDPRGSNVAVVLVNATGDWSAVLQLATVGTGPVTVGMLSGPMLATGQVQRFPASQPAELSIYALDGWYVYAVNGVVAGCLRRPAGDSIATVGIMGGVPPFTVSRCHLIVNRPFLRRGAPTPDYRVAGSPTPGGLRGDYFLEVDAWAKSDGGNYGRFWTQALAPLAEPYARRLDPQLSFSGSTWMPPGPPGGRRFSVRWSGSIYLPLGERNMRMGLYGGGGQTLIGMIRVWVGPTRAGQPYMDATWPGEGQADLQAPTQLREHLGTNRSGWYPIVVEYAVGATTNAPRFVLTYSDSTGQTPVLAEHLSPYGCWDGDLGGESHREAIDGTCASMGLRWRVQPKTLESGEFPGRLEAGIQLGRDTDYVLAEDEATEYASEVSAAEAVDQIIAEAAGLGDNLGREGLTATMTDPNAAAQPWVMTRSEQLADITEEAMLRQRMSSLLALYGTPMETVAARPRGHDELTDTFPVTGTAELFLWEPDDGIRLELPTIGVLDQTPRRITSVTWPLMPDGRGAPSVGFRQRPKHLRATLARLMRQSATQHRRYQGQLAETTGTMGGVGGGVASDANSRIWLPPGSSARLVLRASFVSGTAAVTVNGTATGLQITAPGDYDLSAWAPAAGGRCTATLTGAGVTAEFQLVATIRI